MNEAAEIIEAMGRGIATLRAARHRAVVKVRMHPLDIGVLERHYLNPRSESDWRFFDPRFRPLCVMGVPVEPDDSLLRGRPEAEYADQP